MTTPRVDETIRELLTPVIEACELEMDSVVILSQSGMKLVRVTIDTHEGEGRLDSDTLARVSTQVSACLDKADPIEGEYLLEVSTPGAERQLLLPTHWRRQIGRLVHAKLRDGTHIEGRVRAADDEGVTLDVEGTSTTIEYTQVKKARARVEFTSVDEGEE